MIRSRPDITLSMSPSSRTERALSSTSASSVPRALKPSPTTAPLPLWPFPFSAGLIRWSPCLELMARPLPESGNPLRRNYYLIG